MRIVVIMMHIYRLGRLIAEEHKIVSAWFKKRRLRKQWNFKVWCCCKNSTVRVTRNAPLNGIGLSHQNFQSSPLLHEGPYKSGFVHLSQNAPVRFPSHWQVPFPVYPSEHRPLPPQTVPEGSLGQPVEIATLSLSTSIENIVKQYDPNFTRATILSNRLHRHHLDNF